MGLEVINVLDPFLAFVITWNLITTDNMCAFQQHPNFKSLWCVMECTSKYKTRVIVERDHEQVIMSLLLKVANNLNLQCVASPTSLTYHMFQWFLQRLKKPISFSRKQNCHYVNELLQVRKIWNYSCNREKVKRKKSMLLHSLLGNFWVFRELQLKLKIFKKFMAYKQVCGKFSLNCKTWPTCDDLE
jgi:hypothetical protein